MRLNGLPERPDRAFDVPDAHCPVGRLYLGDEIDLPCPLTAAQPEKSNALSDWCFGFIEAVAIEEDAWFANPEMTEAVAELILPAGILSGQFDEPELEHLIFDQQARQEMADRLLENDGTH